jgi:predicted DNA-binding transcriptional regulator AlpA
MNEHRPRALTEHDVAERLRLSVATLRAWRTKGKGPRFVRLGRAIRYLESDIDRFVDRCAVEAGAGTDSAPNQDRFTT